MFENPTLKLRSDNPQPSAIIFVQTDKDALPCHQQVLSGTPCGDCAQADTTPFPIGCVPHPGRGSDRGALAGRPTPQQPHLQVATADLQSSSYYLQHPGSCNTRHGRGGVELRTAQSEPISSPSAQLHGDTESIPVGTGGAEVPTPASQRPVGVGRPGTPSSLQDGGRESPGRGVEATTAYPQWCLHRDWQQLLQWNKMTDRQTDVEW